MRNIFYEITFFDNNCIEPYSEYLKKVVVLIECQKNKLMQNLKVLIINNVLNITN